MDDFGYTTATLMLPLCRLEDLKLLFCYRDSVIIKKPGLYQALVCVILKNSGFPEKI